MPIDLSAFKNIDFSNRNNLIFLVIVFILAAIIFFVVWLIFIEFMKMSKRAVMRLLNTEAKKPKFIREEEQKKADFEKEKFYEEFGLGQVPKERRTPAGVEFFAGAKPKTQEPKKNSIEAQKEKAKKDIEYGLSYLKTRSGSEQEKNTLESIMPSRDNLEDPEKREIKIPHKKLGAKENESGGEPIPAGASPEAMALESKDSEEENADKKEENKIKIPSSESNKKINSGFKHRVLYKDIPAEAFESNAGSLHQVAKNQNSSHPDDASPIFEKPDFLDRPLAPHSADNKAVLNESLHAQSFKESGSEEKSIFGGKDKVSMKKVVYDMVENPLSGYDTVGGQSYSRQERAEIAKKISQFGKFGSLLQKSERSKIYSALEEERLKASPSQRVKIDKQVRFLKKIVGK